MLALRTVTYCTENEGTPERSFQIAPPSSVGKSIATALLVVEYALLLTKETTKSLNRAAPLSKLILTQFR